ncbi:MAG TPA: hypothetical protein PKD24_11450 [Pyrinomonadaceae bacterium]|nr:hypothetical protein [Pyrinomonadaceae bacterium]HMP66131.1 hypothetical protein [Pyrinomonadaceae bacterium]
MKKNDPSQRRKFLKSAAATLVAASVPVTAATKGGRGGDDNVSGNQKSDVYLHGCAWNRDLPGVFGRACYTFEVRAKVGGTGVGTIRDDVYSEINSQIQINRVTRRGKTYTLEGEIVASRSPQMVGMDVVIAATSSGNGAGSAAITVSSRESADLVVIAIIAILIQVLTPAVHH